MTLDYKYADSDAGCAAGTLTLESNFDSDYQMYRAYEMQSYNPRINITDYDGTTATMVHVSSVAAPRTSDIKSPSIVSNPGTMSEGLLIKVYNGHIVVSGIDFINSQLLSYAYYNINTK